MLVTLEGCDFVGKTVVGLKLEKLITNSRFTREPGGTRAGEMIRDILENVSVYPATELMLFIAARLEHVMSWDLANEVIICDRYIDSTRVYQGFKFDGATIEPLLELFPEPDITILLTCSIEQAKKRSANRASSAKLDADIGLFASRQERFIALADKYPDRIKRVDTTDRLVADTVERVYKLIKVKL